MTIDLSPFCGREKLRGMDVTRPWSCGEYSYATDGYIAIRTAKRVAVDENPTAPLVGTLPFDRTGPYVAWNYEIPPEEEHALDCPRCDGRGRDHKCPDCECECSFCGGDGTITSADRRSMSFRCIPFELKYLRLIASLPALEVCTDVANRILVFRFAGGCGCMRGLGSPFDDHLGAIDPALPNDDRRGEPRGGATS